MCGIIAYKGPQNAKDVVINGLKQLEYRGYDSWGISSGTEIFKDVGRVKSEFPFPDCNVAIGHTRWATTGAVNQENAHPHLSMNGRISVVHNGIVENYIELREWLLHEGFECKTDTDTEVIPNIIEYYMREGLDFVNAFRSTLLKLEGYYAVVALYDGVICFGRNGSPLVLGIGLGEYFVASDVPAFLDKCKDVIYLDDDEYGVISSSYELFKLSDGSKVNKKVDHVEWTIEQAQKGDYEHFMLKEINEQRNSIKRAIEMNKDKVNTIANMIGEARGVFFVGCGSSYNACVSAAYEFSHIAKKHVNVVLGSEFRNQEEFLTDETLMIIVSQSGETVDLIDAVKVAKSKGVKIASIVNVMGSSLMRMSDESALMNCGPEICVLSTKSYTSQVAILLLLAYTVAGKFDEGYSVLSSAADRVGKIIDDNIALIKKIASSTKDSRDYFLIGRDLAYPSALEGALKIKEVSYIHAEGFAGGELKHGTIALIEKNVPVIVFCTDRTRKHIISNAGEIKARGGFIIGIGSVRNEVFDEFIFVDEFDSANPILMIIPVQILAYYLAVLRGCDPDKPRNLAKSVTVK
jgi:glutamine---fructose-6-phosphate transaminase (isomerizing)